MRTPLYPSDLTNEQWSVLAPLLPLAPEKGRRREADVREVVNAIFYLNRAGCPWRMLPRDFPPWRTVYNYFEAFKQDGVWGDILTALRQLYWFSENRNLAFESVARVEGRWRCLITL